MAAALISVRGTTESGKTVTCSVGDLFTLRAKGGRPECPENEYDFGMAIEVLRYAAKYKKSSASLIIERDTIERIPVICMAREKAESLPVVIFVHGYTGDKIGAIRAGMDLAEAGFFAILPDARMHGERRPDNFELKFSRAFAKTYLQLLKGTVRDISWLINYYKDDSRADTDRLGVSGTSMGGIIAFLAATSEKRIKAAVPIIGTPDLELFAKWPNSPPPEEKIKLELRKLSPLTNHAKMKNIALLVQSGGKDNKALLSGCRKLDKVLTKPANTLKAYRHIEYPETGHELSDKMVTQMVKWFGRFL